jgi:hypothetical protein
MQKKKETLLKLKPNLGLTYLSTLDKGEIQVTMYIGSLHTKYGDVFDVKLRRVDSPNVFGGYFHNYFLRVGCQSIPLREVYRRGLQGEIKFTARSHRVTRDDLKRLVPKLKAFLEKVGVKVSPAN